MTAIVPNPTSPRPMSERNTLITNDIFDEGLFGTLFAI